MPHKPMMNTELHYSCSQAVLAQWRKIIPATLAGLFLAEFAVMLMLEQMNIEWGYATGLLDAAILTVLILPGLYFVVLRPVAVQSALFASASADARFRAVVEAAGDAIIVSDKDGQILFVNPIGLSLLGYSLAELEARPIADLLPPEPVTIQQANRDTCSESDRVPVSTSTTVETLVVANGGKKIPVEIKLNATAPPGDRLFVRVIRDLRPQKRINMYESVLPVCCVCGDIRDDTAVEHGCGEWGSLEDYVKRRLTTEFSHSYCPQCKSEYLRRYGLNAQPENDMLNDSGAC